MIKTSFAFATHGNAHGTNRVTCFQHGLTFNTTTKLKEQVHCLDVEGKKNESCCPWVVYVLELGSWGALCLPRYFDSYTHGILKYHKTGTPEA